MITLAEIKNKLAGKCTAHVVGGGNSGRAVIKLLNSYGVPLVFHEQKEEKLLPEFKRFLQEQNIPCFFGEHKKENFSGCDIFIPSPGAAIAQFAGLLPETALAVSETEIAYLFCDDTPILGITGTSGKTTTTAVCSEMLKEQGLNIFTGGNIGTPLSEYALKRLENPRSEKADVLVLELSSFQLQTCNALPVHVGICLNISENHLDYHKNMQEYTDAKMNLFAHQTDTDFAVLGQDIAHLAIEYGFKAKTIVFDTDKKNFPKTKLLGQHNQSNAEAAWQACQLFGVSFENARKAMEKISPMENRLEFVREHDGITYINDSKCTTVTALAVAIKAVSEAKHPIILLAGGKFKGGDLAALLPLMRGKVKHVALYGGSREHFENAWKNHLSLSYDEKLSQALERAKQTADKGDAVLLAPATASFDQYASYIARGGDFKNLVRNLK